MSSDAELIWFDIDAFEEALNTATDDSRRAVQAAIYSTMSKVRKHARTLASSYIRDKYKIAKKDLDKRLRIRVGSRGDKSYQSFELIIKGTSISLSYFGAKQFAGNRVITRKKGMQNKRRSSFQGVQVEVIKNRRTRLKRAFLHTAASGHVLVMQRRKSGRSARVKAVVSPATMFGRDGLNYFEEDIVEFLERTFEHELARRLDMAGL